MFDARRLSGKTSVHQLVISRAEDHIGDGGLFCCV
jgi:hypothetical protein